ncbi:MAG: hypothetical protein GXP49_08595 [Deltaproteobacteria bacterium]|nr:hypothetical protein [Deltaproteobacteria bacterium]
MDDLDRRNFIRILTASSLGGGLVLLGCSRKGGATVRFDQGVASGDPTGTSVVLWTRAVPSNGLEVLVHFQVSRDQFFRDVVLTGKSTALLEADFTVRVKVDGLDPGTHYYYRFEANGCRSEVGRTLTAPSPDSDRPVKFGVAYGQALVGRYFNSWQVMCRTDPDLDFVLFLGDYIYEFDRIPGAQEPTPDRKVDLPDGLALGDGDKDGMVARTLRDYRTLYRTWRSDPNLKSAHRMFPFITIWDDHEFANDCWQDHANDFDGARGDEKETARREAATRAFYEYIPVDVAYQPDKGFPNDIRLYRSLRFGSNVEIFLTDQRYYRDDHVVPEGPIDLNVGKLQENSEIGSRIFALKDGFDKEEAAKKPTMLGKNQLSWIEQSVLESDATWKLLASPTIVSQMLLDLRNMNDLPAMLRNVFYFKLDQWDGYRSERAKLISKLESVENLVILTGDIHGTLVSKVYTDFDSPSDKPATVEYVGPSISALSVFEQLAVAVEIDENLKKMGLQDTVGRIDDVLMNSNPHYEYVDTKAYGYAVVDVRQEEEVRVTMVHLDDVQSPAIDQPVRRVSFKTPGGEAAVEKEG